MNDNDFFFHINLSHIGEEKEYYHRNIKLLVNSKIFLHLADISIFSIQKKGKEKIAINL